MKSLRSITAIASIIICLACTKNDPATKPESMIDTKTYTEGEYTLIFKNNDEEFLVETREKMVSTFFTVYPKLAKRFNPQAIHTVTFVVDTQDSGIAGAANGEVHFGANYLAKNPHDTDVVTHEVMHIVQDYKGENIPGWLTEGLADYARYTYGVDNEGWSLQPLNDGQNYTDGYGVTGSFLVWLEENVDVNIATELNAALHAQTYTSYTWVELTGKTVDELWLAYYY